MTDKHVNCGDIGHTDMYTNQNINSMHCQKMIIQKCFENMIEIRCFRGQK